MANMDPSKKFKRHRGFNTLGREMLAVPDEALLGQYAVSRALWSEHMRGRLTARDLTTGGYVQIPRDQFDPSIHTFSTVGLTTVKDPDTGEFKTLPVDHPDVVSGHFPHMNVGMVTAIDSVKGSNVHITSAEYQAHPERYTTAGTGRTDLKPNLTRTSILDATGTFRWVEQDHPDLQANLASGLWRPPFKGKLTVIEVATGRRSSVPADDPRIATGELVPQSKGMATVVDRTGKVFQVPKDDPRIATGELVAQNTGRLRSIVVATGERCRAYPSDPRFATGEIKLQDLKRDTLKLLSVYDQDGTRRRVREGDPRLLSGEFTLKLRTNHDVSALDAWGNELRVPKTDPRLQTGELKLKYPHRFKDVVAPTGRQRGFIGGALPDGTHVTVPKDDPRIRSGEIRLDYPHRYKDLRSQP